MPSWYNKVGYVLLGAAMMVILLVLLAKFLPRQNEMPLAQFEGEVQVAKLFMAPDNTKWLLTVKTSADNTHQLLSGEFVSPPMQPSTTYTVNSEDSRVNNIVKTSPVDCVQSGPVTICDYEVVSPYIVFVYTEVLGSDGLPEYNVSLR